MNQSVQEAWRRELFRRALTLPDVTIDEACAAVAVAIQEQPRPPADAAFLRDLPGVGVALSILDDAIRDLDDGSAAKVIAEGVHRLPAGYISDAPAAREEAEADQPAAFSCQVTPLHRLPPWLRQLNKITRNYS